MDAAFGFINFDEPLNDDPSKPPSSGIEYLKRVQREAMKCPEVVTVVKQQTNDNFKEDVTIEELSAKKTQVEKEEQRIERNMYSNISYAFANLRQSLTAYKMTEHSTLPAVRLPLKQNIQTWCGFCFGEAFLHRCYKDCLSDEAVAQCKDRAGYPPGVSIVAQFTMTLAVQVLEYHLTWLDVVGFSPAQGRWLYALMMCVDKPTPQDAMSLLRMLARKCKELRATHPQYTEHLNIFVAVVHFHYGQKDLQIWS